VFVLGGVIGLLVWSWLRHRSRPGAGGLWRRVGAAAMAIAVAVLGVGAVWRLTVTFGTVKTCQPPPGASAAETSASRRPIDASLAAQIAATWSVTGLGMAYARLLGGRLCLFAPADYYVALRSQGFTDGHTTNVGDVVLSPAQNTALANIRALALHESRHRPQWAVATVAAGPAGFPVAYALDEFFFPGSRNHFERLAGLRSGGYRPAGTGPVLGVAQVVVLVVAGCVVAGVLIGRRARHRGSRPGTGRG
jgi:hypothetical protein